MTTLSPAAVDFVGSVSRARSIDELCTRYLARIGEFIDSYSAGIYVLDGQTRRVENIDARGVSSFFLSRYEQAGRQHDPLLRNVLDEQRACDNTEVMSGEEWSASPLYGEVLHLHRMTNLLEAPIVADGAVIGTLNFGRQDEHGAFGAPERATAETLGRLLGIALDSVRGSVDLRRERDRALAGLELCSDAVVMTDMSASERVANRAARALLGTLTDADAILDELLERSARDTSRVHGVQVTLGVGRIAALRARTVSLPAPNEVLWSLLELEEAGDVSQRAVLAQSELTAREREVAALAVSGLHDREIAERLYLSPHTVKQYLKACYRKLGVRSRVDLTRLIMASPPASGLEITNESSSPAGSPP
jgi:DNA-binding CsgD family transcriptional regulator